MASFLHWMLSGAICLLTKSAITATQTTSPRLLISKLAFTTGFRTGSGHTTVIALLEFGYRWQCPFHRSFFRPSIFFDRSPFNFNNGVWTIWLITISEFKWEYTCTVIFVFLFLLPLQDPGFHFSSFFPFLIRCPINSSFSFFSRSVCISFSPVFLHVCFRFFYKKVYLHFLF